MRSVVRSKCFSAGRTSAWALALLSAALTQPSPGRAQVVETDAGVETAPPAPLASLEDRLAALEAERQARERVLEARVATLEAEAAARASAVEVPAAPSGPIVRPLAYLITRFEHREGYDALASGRALTNIGCYAGLGLAPTLSDSDCIRYRARVGVEITNLVLGPEVTASIRFTPQVAGYWALPGFGIAVPGGIGASSSGGAVDALLGLHEGSLALQFGTAVRAEIGRFEMNYGDGVVIGNLDWHPNGRAFDGARLHITPQPGSYWIDAFWTLVNEGHAVSLTGAPPNPGFGQADQSFYGLYAGLGPLLDAAPTTALDVYALGRQTNNRAALDAMGNPSEREWSLRATIGARLRYRVDVVDFRVEGALQTGREGALRAAGGGVFGNAQTVLAGFGIGEIGLNLVENRLRLALEGNYGSGNASCTGLGCTDSINEGYDALFPTAHAFLGYTNVMGQRTNSASGAFHLSARPIDPLQITLDWHVFVIPERAANVASNFAGQEGDINVIWSPWPGLRGRVLYGIFLPETAAWRPAGAMNYTTAPVHFLEVELLYVLR